MGEEEEEEEEEDNAPALGALLRANIEAIDPAPAPFPFPFPFPFSFNLPFPVDAPVRPPRLPCPPRLLEGAEDVDDAARFPGGFPPPPPKKLRFLSPLLLPPLPLPPLLPPLLPLPWPPLPPPLPPMLLLLLLPFAPPTGVRTLGWYAALSAPARCPSEAAIA